MDERMDFRDTHIDYILINRLKMFLENLTLQFSKCKIGFSLLVCITKCEIVFLLLQNSKLHNEGEHKRTAAT